jgi:RNA polymerase sigma factor (sigma-70 family)
MATRRLHKMVADLRRVLAPPEPDSALLARFVLRRDEDAFAALVRRYGAMVLGICRRVLRHEQDAEDAFQATFLILARKARALRRRQALASWLYTVAQRTARQLRVAQVRRRLHERQVEVLPQTPTRPVESADWLPLLDHELSRLPERYRAAVVLCDLHGQPRRVAALQLGLSDGTLSRRLTAGRRLLAQRLTRRGVVLSGGAVATALTSGVSPALPAGLAKLTARAAVLVAGGQAAALVSPAVILMNQVLRSMLMTKLKIGVAVLMLIVCGGGVAYRATGQSPKAEPRAVSEFELLRREIELLRLRVERVQEQVQNQQAELRALRGVSAGPQKGVEGKETGQGEKVLIIGEEKLWRNGQLGLPADPTAKDEIRRPDEKPATNTAKDKEDQPKRPRFEALKKHPRMPTGSGDKADPTVRAEAALDALRNAKDSATLMRAADELEQVLQEIRQQLQNNNRRK